MRYFSTFSGVGGMELLFPKEWELVGYSEWDKYASMVHKYHTPSKQNYGDISNIDWNRVPDFDLLTGGSPCQDFSVAGKRRGLGGSKSSLAWGFIRILRVKKPKHFIWENVKGTLSSRSGWDFANLISAFSEEGYSLWWQVLNAKDFGVPQNRERIFVVGTREGSPKEVFFEPSADGKNIENLQPGAGQADRIHNPAGLSPTIPTAGGGRHIPMIINDPSRKKGTQESGIMPTLRSEAHGNLPVIMNMHTSARNPKRKTANRGGQARSQATKIVSH